MAPVGDEVPHEPQHQRNRVRSRASMEADEGANVPRYRIQPRSPTFEELEEMGVFGHVEDPDSVLTHTWDAELDSPTNSTTLVPVAEDFSGLGMESDDDDSDSFENIEIPVEDQVIEGDPDEESIIDVPMEDALDSETYDLVEHNTEAGHVEPDPVLEQSPVIVTEEEVKFPNPQDPSVMLTRSQAFRGLRAFNGPPIGGNRNKSVTFADPLEEYRGNSRDKGKEQIVGNTLGESSGPYVICNESGPMELCQFNTHSYEYEEVKIPAGRKASGMLPKRSRITKKDDE